MDGCTLWKDYYESSQGGLFTGLFSCHLYRRHCLEHFFGNAVNLNIKFAVAVASTNTSKFYKYVWILHHTCPSPNTFMSMSLNKIVSQHNWDFLSCPSSPLPPCGNKIWKVTLIPLYLGQFPGRHKGSGSHKVEAGLSVREDSRRNPCSVTLQCFLQCFFYSLNFPNSPPTLSKLIAVLF